MSVATIDKPVVRAPVYEMLELPRLKPRDTQEPTPSPQVVADQAIDRILGTAGTVLAGRNPSWDFSDGLGLFGTASMVVLGGILVSVGWRAGDIVAGLQYGGALFAGAAVAGGSGISRAIKKWRADRQTWRALDLRSVASALRPIDREIVRDLAIRSLKMMNGQDHDNGASERLAVQPSVHLSRASAEAVSLVTRALFHDYSLRPRKDPLQNIERVIHALESCSADDREILAHFIGKVLKPRLPAIADMATVEGVRQAMLQAALEGRRYHFDRENLDAKTQGALIVVGGVRISRAAFERRHRHLPVWGRGFCDSMTDALAAAGRLEAEGYRVSIGHHLEPRQPPISVIAYDEKREPGLFMHTRFPVDFRLDGGNEVPANASRHIDP